MATDFDTWLKQIGLADYADVFRRNAIDFDVVADLSEDDLREIYLPIGHRKRFLKAALALNEKSPAMTYAGPRAMPEQPAIPKTLPALLEQHPADSSGVPQAQPIANGHSAETTSSDLERRQAAIMFADLTGYTSLSAELDPEELQDVMAEFFRVADNAIEEHGGTVDKHLGDGVMAVFGAPISHGDDTSRSVQAATAIHEGLRAVSTKLSRDLTSHIGIASGEVLAGAGSNQYTVIGDAVNLASRLSDLAKAHETFLSNDVRADVAHETLCEERANVTIKGLAEPVTVWKVVGRRAEPLERNLLPFVGREAERAQFNSTIEAIPEKGAGAAFILRGEPGIGKTRLATECLAVARQLGFATHHVLVLDFGGATGTDPLRSIFKSLVDVANVTDQSDLIAAATDLLAKPEFESDDEAFVYDLLGLPMSEEVQAFYRAIENTTRNRRKGELVGRVLEAASREKPQIILVEDLHWADQVTKDLCAALVARASGCPSVLLMTSRLEGDPFDRVWRSATGSTPIYTIDLRPLSSRETQSLAEIAGVDQAEALAAEIDKAGGNPLFLEMMIRSTADSQTDALSGNLRSMVQARVDRLDPVDRRAIQAASVAGQRFDLALVQHLINEPDYVPQGLLERSLVHPMGEQYLFAHALVQEGVYASVTRRNAQAMHLKAADWYGERDLVLRAEHLAKAEDDRAAQAYLNAARNLMDVLRFETATQILNRGLAIAKERIDVYDLNMALGETAFQIGDQAQATIAYERASGSAVGDKEVCKAKLGLALSFRDRTDVPMEKVWATLDQTEAIANRLGSVEMKFQSLYLRSYMHSIAAQPDACLNNAKSAVECAQALDDQSMLLKAYEVVAMAFYQNGLIESCREPHEAMYALATSKNVPEHRIVAGYQGAMLHFYAANFEEGMRMAGVPMAEAERYGHHRAAVLGHEVAARINLAIGNLEDAELYAQKSLQLAETAGMRARVAMANIHLSEIARLRRDQACEKFAIAAVENSIGPYIRPWSLAALALAQESTENAGDYFEEADGLLDAGACTGINHFHVRILQMEHSLCLEDWDGIELAADKLEKFTRPEPLNWTDFHIKRGRTIAKWGRDEIDDVYQASLDELRATRSDTGMKIWLPGDQA